MQRKERSLLDIKPFGPATKNILAPKHLPFLKTKQLYEHNFLFFKLCSSTVTPFCFEEKNGRVYEGVES